MKSIVYYILLIIVNSVPIRAQNWTIIDTNITHTNASLNYAFFTNDSTGYTVGGWGWGAGVILKTTNAGASWNLKIVNYDLQNVFFSSQDTGYAVGEHCSIMKTTDAGATWIYQSAPVSTAYMATSVCFLNNNTGFVALKNGPGYAFLKTHNGGQTWVNDISDTVQLDYFTIINDSTIYGLYGAISKTTDYGNSWIRYNSIPTGAWASSLCFLNDTLGFATTDNANGVPCFNYSSLIKTTNGGQSWTETVYPCDILYSLCFPGNKTGYMLGSINIGGIRKIWKTKDGGDTWLLSNYPVGSAYDTTGCGGNYLICTDPNTCYIFTNYGTIIKTTNGGGNVGISEFQENNNEELNIYPNPSCTNNISVDFPLIEKGTCQIFNTIGEVIYQNEISDKSSTSINIETFPKGCYFIRITEKDNMMMGKFIKL